MSRFVVILLAIPALVLIGPARGQTPSSPGGQQSFTGDTPESMEGVGVDQRLGEQLPLDLSFTNHRGKVVTLGELIEGDRPVVLIPVYYNCPMLCTLVLNGLMEGLEGVDWTIGEEFKVVTYSVSPDETAELAATKRKGYIALYGRDVSDDEWPWLVGDLETINTLNDALGYRIRRQSDGLIAHASSVMFITPDGRISKYMNDVIFKPRDVRLALVEASEGSIGTAVDQFLLFTCFQFSPDANGYVLGAWKLMRSAGLVTLLLILGGLVVLFRRDHGSADRVPSFGGESHA